MAKPTFNELQNRFVYHPPTTDSRKTKHAQVTAACLKLAQEICLLCPEGRGLSTALTKIEEARMWANQSLACDSPTAD